MPLALGLDFNEPKMPRKLLHLDISLQSIFCFDLGYQSLGLGANIRRKTQWWTMNFEMESKITLSNFSIVNHDDDRMNRM